MVIEVSESALLRQSDAAVARSMTAPQLGGTTTGQAGYNIVRGYAALDSVAEALSRGSEKISPAMEFAANRAIR
jgi:hypothetical protein